MTQDQVTHADLHNMWSRFESTVETLAEEVQSIKEKVERLAEEVQSIKEKVERLAEEVHQMKCITTVREVTTKLDAHLANQLCEAHSANPTVCLYKFDKENRRRDGRKLKNKIGSAQNCLPLQAIPVLINAISSLKREGNKQNHTVYQYCVGESVEKIQAKMESGVNKSKISQHLKKVANIVARQAIDEVAPTPTPNKRHPPASPLVSTSPTKKLKEWPLLSPSE
jgi:uncharacterized protein YoxC